MLTRDSVAAEPCKCVRCLFCRGKGFTSSYERNQFDWDTETCEECGGSGITETCGRCEYLADLDSQEELFREEPPELRRAPTEEGGVVYTDDKPIIEDDEPAPYDWDGQAEL